MTEILRSLRSLRMTAKRKPKTTKPALFALAFISLFCKNLNFTSKKCSQKLNLNPKFTNFLNFASFVRKNKPIKPAKKHKIKFPYKIYKLKENLRFFLFV